VYDAVLAIPWYCIYWSAKFKNNFIVVFFFAGLSSGSATLP
jgi:hypothetical protein